MNTNSENPYVGRSFQERVQKIAENEYKQAFLPEKSVEIKSIKGVGEKRAEEIMVVIEKWMFGE